MDFKWDTGYIHVNQDQFFTLSKKEQKNFWKVIGKTIKSQNPPKITTKENKNVNQ